MVFFYIYIWIHLFHNRFIHFSNKLHENLKQEHKQDEVVYYYDTKA